MAISPAMQIAVRLAGDNALSLKIFDNNDMKQLFVHAKKGLNDNSKTTINSNNVTKSTCEFADIKRGEIRKKLRKAIINLTADFATCKRRSFLGTIYKMKRNCYFYND